MQIEKSVANQPDFTPGKVITFPEGIPGFETYTKFHVFHKQENDAWAYWLESVDDPKLTFTLVDPTVYDLWYELNLTDREQELLKVSNPCTCGVFLMLRKEEGKMSPQAGLRANIGGPLVINLENQIGIQKVLVLSRGGIGVLEH